MRERYSVDDAREALQAIPPDLARDEWVKALAGAKAAGVAETDAQAWSELAGNYTAAGFRDTWRSIKANGGIGAGTLFRMAKEAGWRAPSRPDHGAHPPAGLGAPRTATPNSAQPARRPWQDAAEVWARCGPATARHGYIVAKHGRPDGLRVVPDGDPLRIAGLSMGGALVVPVVALGGGAPHSLQFIAPPELAAQWKAAGKPSKLNLPGAELAGGAFVVGDLGGATDDPVYVVEGIGQAWACWQATGNPAAVAFGAGNLRKVAAELRRQWPAAAVVLVPDAGKEAQAERAAAELGALLVTMPDGSPDNSDANDYAQAEGADALAALLAQARAPVAAESLPDADAIDDPAAATCLPVWSLVPVDDLDAAELPPQAWAWDGYIPAGELTLLGAHGGTGKSTVALMLAVCVAVGLPLFGVATTSAPVVFYSGEDGAHTVRRRLQHVCKLLEVPAQLLAPRLRVLDATDAPELAAPTWQDGAGGGRTSVGLTAAGYALRDFMACQPGALLIVDNASDTMGGNENARPEVRAFVRLLVGMVRGHGGSVLLLSHVDKGTSRGSGLTGSENYSGSTAWHNSARSRLFMSRDKATGGLLLEHQKCNLGPLREPLRLAWPSDGLPMLEAPMSANARAYEARTATASLLRLIHEFTSRGEFISAATTSRTHAGKLLRSAAGFPSRLSDAQVFELLRDAERRGWLIRETYTKSNRHPAERWQVTTAGAAVAGLYGGASTALTALTSGVGAPDDADAPRGTEAAPTAPTSALGGVGEGARAEVVALAAGEGGEG